MNIYDLQSDIYGEDYIKLLNYAMRICDKFILVIQINTMFNYYSFEVLKNLEPFLISKIEGSEWPGTELLGHKAIILKYRYNNNSRSVLTMTASSLYAWQHPKLPEDLCLLRPSDESWLVTTPRDDDGYLTVTDDEYHALIKDIPEMSKYFKKALA